MYIYIIYQFVGWVRHDNKLFDDEKIMNRVVTQHQYGEQTNMTKINQ